MVKGEDPNVAAMAEFAGRQVAPRREALLRPDGFPRDLWSALGAAGLLGIALPRDHGGSGGGYRLLSRCGAALARQGGSLGLASSWLGHCLTGRFFLAGFGDAAQQARWLRPLARGEATLAIAISEPGIGAHPKHLAATAARLDAGWRLEGEKAYVTNGPIAAAFIVLAVSGNEAGRKRFSAFLVPRGTPGLALTPGPEVDFLRPSPHCGLKLAGCIVPPDALLGPEGEAFALLSIPFRDVEDALGCGTMTGALHHLLDRMAEAVAAQEGDARLAAAAELGALAGLAAALDSVALGLAVTLDDGAAPAATAAGVIGFRMMVRLMIERLEALRHRLAFPWSVAAAALLRDIEKSLDIARGPRLARQSRLGLSLLEASPS